MREIDRYIMAIYCNISQAIYNVYVGFELLIFLNLWVYQEKKKKGFDVDPTFDKKKKTTIGLLGYIMGTCMALFL